MAGVVKNTPGAIGYADVAYALDNKLRFAKVKNKAGAFATPGIRGAVAAAGSIKTIPADNAISLVDPPASAGKLAYPIATYTWAIVPLAAKQAKPVKQFLLFAISKTGQASGLKLLYAPIPDSVRVAAAKTHREGQAGLEQTEPRSTAILPPLSQTGAGWRTVRQ